MPTILTVTKKEFEDLFYSPIAYVFLTVFLFLSFWLFFTNLFSTGQASMRPLFGSFPLLLLIFLPAITMSQWAEEKKRGTLETLLTLPIRDRDLILGKWLATFLFLAVALLLTLPACLTVSFMGNIDGGMVLASYLGIFLMGGCYLAVGLFISSLTENQIIAFILTTVVLFVFYLMGSPLVLNYVPQSLSPLFSFISLSGHYESSVRGVIDSRDVLYSLSFAWFFIYLNQLSLESRQWH